jgi:uncharacterized protein YecT (DUF1311 family)
MHILQKGIVTMSKFKLMIAAAMMLAPVALIAKTPAHDGYAHFTLTKTELAQMPNAADRTCLEAAIKASNENARIACNRSTYKRIDARLNGSFRAIVAKLPKMRGDALLQEENAWLATRDKICASGAARELNRASVSYRAVMSDCGLAELYRRTLWVARYR